MSQLSRRYEEKMKEDKELRGVLDKIKREDLLNVETPVVTPVTPVT